MSKKFDVLCAGLIVVDIIGSPIDRNIFDKDSVYIDSISLCSGGDAFNVSVNTAKQGLSVAIAGNIGNDRFGDHILAQAAKYGIDTQKIKRLDETSTATSMALCESTGERHFAYSPGANRHFDGSGLDDMLASAKLLYIGSMLGLPGLENGNLTRLFAAAKEKGVITAVDTTWSENDDWMSVFDGALAYTDIFIPSYEEAVKLTGHKGKAEIVGFLKEQGVSVAGVKLGSEGAYIEGMDIPVINTDMVVDTTGAGDAFMSGFVCGYIKGRPIYECGLLGSAAASFCIEKFGAATNTRSFDETMERVGFLNET